MRQKSASAGGQLVSTFGSNQDLRLGVRRDSGAFGNDREPVPVSSERPVFIPAVDMMGHTVGFLSTWDRYKIDFDRTQRDLVSLLLSPELRRMSGDWVEQFQALTLLLGGNIELEGERFILSTPTGNLQMPLVAEGLRKIATLWRLIQVDALNPGVVLFWDEPEVNLNPKLMAQVVAAILNLSRLGVQVFLATHSYIMLEELSVQAEAGEVRYFGFKPTNDGVEVNHYDELSAVKPNAILDQFESLYERQMATTLGELNPS